MNTTSALQKLDDSTIKLTITIPANEVKKAWDEVLDQTQKSAKLSGFRKGKAPKKLVEQNIDTEKVREEVLKKLLPQAYIEAVQKNNIKPIINPKIHVDPDSIGVEKIEESNDWQFVALTCEAPEVQLGKYKEEIQKITAKSKIIVPGKEPQKPAFEDIVKALLENAAIIIPGLLIEHEVDRLLSQMLDEVKKLGLTLDQYLSSTNKTPQGLRDEYKKKAENDIKLEFVLQKIAESENITVEPTEIDEAIQKAKDDSERKQLETNKYLLASILRQQKTLDFLKSL